MRRYVYGPGVDTPLVWYEGAGTMDRRWLIPDERGSIIAVTGASGDVMTINGNPAINRYDEYGIPASTNVGRFQYTGQAWIPELGMYYYKARIYSPTLGRFMQTDPIGYDDGMNLYNYVGSDPVNFSDPSGLRSKDPDTQYKRIEPLPMSSSSATSDEIVVNGQRRKKASPDAGAFASLLDLLALREQLANLGNITRVVDGEVEIVVTAKKAKPTGPCKIPQICPPAKFSLIPTPEVRMETMKDNLRYLEERARRAKRRACLAAFGEGMRGSLRGGVVGGVGGALAGALGGEGFGPIGFLAGFEIGVWNGGMEAAEKSPNCQ